MGRSLYILGIRVDSLTEAEALERIRSFLNSGTPHHIVTVNPEYIIIAQQHQECREMLTAADLAIADGVGLMWASWFLRQPLAARLPGVDMVERLVALAAVEGYRIYLLGGREGVAAQAAQLLGHRYPRLVVAGTYSGSPRQEDETKIISRIKEAAPHMLFVAYGAPQQDIWIRTNFERLGVPLAMGVGGALDYLSGSVPRAPRWMRKLGLEWLYRLIREPWRWRRMLRLPQFVALVIWSRLATSRS